MKRLWLPLALASLVLIMGGLGIYREAGLRLSHALERFRTALPAGAEFHYGRVRPALLLGGITLHDVSFHYQDTEFHARRVRFGYPKLLSSGTLSLASLMLDSPHYTNKNHQITARRAAFHHLLIPSSAETLHEGHGEADSMHSLAAIMSFEPEDITALRFERMELAGLHVITTTDMAGGSTPIAARPFIMKSLSADSMTVEGYGQGLRVHTLMNGLSLSLHLPTGEESALPAAFRQLLLPGRQNKASSPETPLEMHLAFQHLEARQGYIQWLKRPFRREDNPAESFWQDPAGTLWEKPGLLEVSGLSLLFIQPDQHRTITLSHLSGERQEEKIGLHTEIDLQGLTSHLSPPASLHNSSIALPGHYHISTTARQEESIWRESLQLDTIFGRNSPARLSAELALPDINPLHLSDDSMTRFLREGQCLSTELTLQGSDIFTYYGIIPPPAEDDSNTESPAMPGPSEGPASPAEKPGNTAIPRFSTLALHRSILAPVLDFLLSPAQRSLILRTGPLSLGELAHISTDSNDETRFDRLHVLSVTTQEKH